MYFILALIIILLALFKGKEFAIYIAVNLFILFCFPLGFGFNLLICVFIYLIMWLYKLIKMPSRVKFETYFGVPGSGKSTIAAEFAQRYLKKKKKKKRVFSNMYIKDTLIIEKDDIGYFDISNSVVFFDEAGIDFDNRNYKNNFTKEQVDFLKQHRKYNTDFYFFSQDYADFDIKLRKLCSHLYLVTPSLIPFFIKTREIKKVIGINEYDKQIIDEYKFKFLSGKYYFAPKSWKYFKSTEHKVLPVKEWKSW